MNNVGVISMGIKTPIIREGDDLVKIVVDSVLKATYTNTRYDTVDDKTTKAGWRTERVDTYSINDKDVIGITELLEYQHWKVYVFAPVSVVRTITFPLVLLWRPGITIKSVPSDVI